MGLFRIFLGVIFIALLAYTAVTIYNHGWNLIPIFFGDIKAMTWPGQFNFDFLGFLLLSGLWVSWRHHFSSQGLILGLFALFGGILFLSIYLLIMSYKVDGDIKALMLRPQRSGSI